MTTTLATTNMRAATAAGTLSRLVAAWRTAQQRKRVRAMLMRFDDRMLRDIGITRGDVYAGRF